MSRGPIPDKPRDRPQVPDAMPLVHSIYERHSAGCCMHIVLDDGNLEDGSIEFCRGIAEHDDCRRLADMMLQMTMSQRRRIYARRY